MRFAWIALAAFGLFAQPGPGPGRRPVGRGPMGEGHMGGHMMGRLPATMPSDTNPASPEKVALGRMLFHDPRLSKDNSVSCNSCHDLNNYGVDGRPFSVGVGGQKGGRNSPTVYHAAGQILQFWDGRAADVEEQAKGPVLNPVEMAMPSPAAVEAKLRAVPRYAELFAKAFPGQPEPVTFDNAAKAIGAFERGLVTPSRWDRFLAGERSVLSDREFEGHREFMHTGCAKCHNGPFVGGQSLQKLGVAKAWASTSDTGREGLTKTATDRMVFKVPTLRNVAKTGPYFHDGSVAKLEDAIRLMGEHQLGTQLTARQVGDIAAWLNSLTGEIPLDYVRRPDLP